jgi:DNA-binding transcriptional LysR family regulator
VCVAAPGHPLTRKRRVAVRDLTRTCVAVNLWGEDATVLLALLDEAGLPATSLRLITDSGIAGVLARDHGHVAVVTTSTVAHDLEQGTLRRLPMTGLPPWRVGLVLVVRRRSIEEPAIARLLDAAGSSR